MSTTEVEQITRDLRHVGSTSDLPEVARDATKPGATESRTKHMRLTEAMGNTPYLMQPCFNRGILSRKLHTVGKFTPDGIHCTSTYSRRVGSIHTSHAVCLILHAVQQIERGGPTLNSESEVTVAATKE